MLIDYVLGKTEVIDEWNLDRLDNNSTTTTASPSSSLSPSSLLTAVTNNSNNESNETNAGNNTSPNNNDDDDAYKLNKHIYNSTDTCTSSLQYKSHPFGNNNSTNNTNNNNNLNISLLTWKELLCTICWERQQLDIISLQ